MVSAALDAAELLRAENISVRVVDPVTVKPVDRELIIDCAAETGAIVTAENANIIGGLGSAVAETVCESVPAPVLRVGVEDTFGQTGSVDYLKNEYGLTPEHIAEKVREALILKRR